MGLHHPVVINLMHEETWGAGADTLARGRGRCKFSAHIGLFYKNYDQKVMEKFAPFEKKLSRRKKKARTGGINVDREQLKASRKLYSYIANPNSLNPSCLRHHHALRCMLVHISTRILQSYFYHSDNCPGPLTLAVNTHQSNLLLVPRFVRRDKKTYVPSKRDQYKSKKRSTFDAKVGSGSTPSGRTHRLDIVRSSNSTVT